MLLVLLVVSFEQQKHHVNVIKDFPNEATDNSTIHKAETGSF